MSRARPLACRAVVAEQVETQPGFFRLRCRVPGGFPDPAPGQFVQLRIPDGTDPLLPRPYGICGFERAGGTATFELYYGVVGSGTRALARLIPGQPVGCLGPLGRGYTVDPERSVILVAGGRGVAPLLMLYSSERTRRPVRFAYGSRSAGLAFGLDRIAATDRILATDDGSLGRRGTAYDLLADMPESAWRGSKIYACGPEPLLKRTALFSLERGIPCQVSLEAPFACGVGICRGCALPAAGRPGYVMCCSDGPVFEAEEIDWRRMP